MKKALLMLIFAFLGTALAAAGKAPGIACETTTYDATQRAVTITDVEQLAGAMTEQLAALFEADPKARARAMGRKRAS